MDAQVTPSSRENLASWALCAFAFISEFFVIRNIYIKEVEEQKMTCIEGEKDGGAIAIVTPSEDPWRCWREERDQAHGLAKYRSIPNVSS